MATRSCFYVVLLLLAFQSTVIKANITPLPPLQCLPVLAGTNDRFEFLTNIIIYLADFFLRSSNGTGIEDIAPGLVQGPVPIGATVANLDNGTRAVVREFGLNYIGNLRAILGVTLLNAPFSRPQLNFTAGVFAPILNLSALTPPYNVYANTTQFLVVVNALTSTVLQYYLAQVIPYIAGINQQQVAVGISLTAAEQAGYFRAKLYGMANSTVPPYPFTVANLTNTTATAVNQLGLCGVKNEGVILPQSIGAENQTMTNVVTGDPFSLSPQRTEREVLRILFGTANATRPGGIFPSGFVGALYKLIVILKLY